MEEKKWKVIDNEWIGVINLQTNSRYDTNGIDKHGFNKDGIHTITGTQFDEDGYNSIGFNKKGINKYGINIDGRFANSSNYTVRYVKSIYGHLSDVIDLLANDDVLFSLYSEKFPIFKQRQSERIFDENGIDNNGFDKNGINTQTNLLIDNDGYNALGYDINGFDRQGYDFYGYDKYGYDQYGYKLSRKAIDDVEKKPVKKELTKEELKLKEQNKIQTRKNYLGLKTKAENLANGEMSLEDYIKTSKTSIEDLIRFAKKEKMDSNIIRALYKYIKPYQIYKKPFYKNEYLNSTIIIVDGKEVKPTREDVDKCIEYLIANDILICNKTVSDTVRKFLRGEIDITIKEKSQDLINDDDKDSIESLSDIIINQQKTIKEQQTQIANLKSQRRNLNEQ